MAAVEGLVAAGVEVTVVVVVELVARQLPRLAADSRHLLLRRLVQPRRSRRQGSMWAG